MLDSIVSESDLPLFRSVRTKIDTDLVFLARQFPKEPIAAQWSYLSAIEKAWSLDIPHRALLLRTVYREVDHLVWCFDYFSALLFSLGKSTNSMEWAYLREGIYEFRQFAFGKRVFPNLLCLGGVSLDLSPGAKKRLYTYLYDLTDRVEILFERDLKHYEKRLKEKYSIDRDELDFLSFGGSALKASGGQWDSRFFAPFGAYALQPELRPQFQISRKSPNACAFERVTTAFESLKHTVRVLRKLLEEMSFSGELGVSENSIYEKPLTFAESVIEGSYGPVYTLIYKGDHSVTSGYTRAKTNISRIFDGDQLAMASFGLTLPSGVKL